MMYKEMGILTWKDEHRFPNTGLSEGVSESFKNTETF